MIDGKTDKQLVLESIKEIENYTLNPGTNFVFLVETIWKEYPSEDKLRIRALLLHNGLIHLYNNVPWAFQLTAAGMMLKEDDLKSDGSLKPRKSYKQFWFGVLSTIIGIVLGAIVSYIQDRAKEQFQLKHPTPIVYRPTIQVLHDTILIKTSSKKD